MQTVCAPLNNCHTTCYIFMIELFFINSYKEVKRLNNSPCCGPASGRQGMFESYGMGRVQIYATYAGDLLKHADSSSAHQQ